VHQGPPPPSHRGGAVEPSPARENIAVVGERYEGEEGDVIASTSTAGAEIGVLVLQAAPELARMVASIAAASPST
jgi:hypothetical protein